MYVNVETEGEHVEFTQVQHHRKLSQRIWFKYRLFYGAFEWSLSVFPRLIRVSVRKLPDLETDPWCPYRRRNDVPRNRTRKNECLSQCVHIIFQPILPRPLRLFSDNGWPQSAIALSGGVQGGNNAVIDAVLARSRRYGAPARGITLKVSCQRNATKPSADDSSPEKDKPGRTGKPVRRRKMEGRRKERAFGERRQKWKKIIEWRRGKRGTVDVLLCNTLLFYTRGISYVRVMWLQIERLLSAHSEYNPSRYWHIS